MNRPRGHNLRLSQEYILTRMAECVLHPICTPYHPFSNFVLFGYRYSQKILHSEKILQSNRYPSAWIASLDHRLSRLFEFLPIAWPKAEARGGRTNDRVHAKTRGTPIAGSETRRQIIRTAGPPSNPALAVRPAARAADCRQHSRFGYIVNSMNCPGKSCRTWRFLDVLQGYLWISR
jgi:hypothetical protein